MKNFFNTEGPLFGLLDKIGNLILLGVCWIIGSIPIITLGTSSTALYYAVMKSVRRGQGYSLGEFWRSYKANLGRGVLACVPMLLIAGILCFNLWTLYHAEDGSGNGTLMLASILFLALICFMWVYICPILSRFSMRVGDAWKLAFVMALRFIPYSLVITAGTALLVAVQIWVLPAPAILLIPGPWCYVTTFMMEKALRKYMPAKQENDDAWYYE